MTRNNTVDARERALAALLGIRDLLTDDMHFAEADKAKMDGLIGQFVQNHRAAGNTYDPAELRDRDGLDRLIGWYMGTDSASTPPAFPGGRGAIDGAIRVLRAKDSMRDVMGGHDPGYGLGQM